jgi:hypothetical protein
VRIALDHHYSRVIAERLRDRGYDVIAAVEHGWEREEDEALLVLCASEERVLVTNNVSDFTVIARRWAVQDQSHAGLLFTSDESLPRTLATIGRYVQLLDEFCAGHPGAREFKDRIHWL